MLTFKHANYPFSDLSISKLLAGEFFHTSNNGRISVRLPQGADWRVWGKTRQGVNLDRRTWCFCHGVRDQCAPHPSRNQLANTRRAVRFKLHARLCVEGGESLIK